MLKVFVCKWLLLLLPACVLVACASEREKLVAEAEANRERWTTSRLLDYRFVLQANCFCPLNPRSPVAVEVRNGKAVSVMPVNEDSPFYFFPDTYNSYNTMDKLFDFIQQEAPNKRYRIVSASFDPELGYPTSFHTDTDGRPGNDDELTLHVEQFEVIR